MNSDSFSLQEDNSNNRYVFYIYLSKHQFILRFNPPSDNRSESPVFGSTPKVTMNKGKEMFIDDELYNSKPVIESNSILDDKSDLPSDSQLQQVLKSPEQAIEVFYK